MILIPCTYSLSPDFLFLTCIVEIVDVNRFDLRYGWEKKGTNVSKTTSTVYRANKTGKSHLAGFD